MQKSKLLFLSGGTKLRKSSKESVFSTIKNFDHCYIKSLKKCSKYYDLIFSNVFFSTFLIILILLFSPLSLKSQTQIFFDDFESGTTNWTLTGNWGLATSSYYSTKNSLSDSPKGKYRNSKTTTATLKSVDLSTYQGAELKFWVKYDVEYAFDFVYLEISNNGGSSYNQLDVFTGVSSTWQQLSYNIGEYTGNTNVLIRFRLVTDQYVTADGIYIDDLEIICTYIDNSPPLIIHQGPQHYEGTQEKYVVNAEITDISGVSSTTLNYWVDSGEVFSIAGTQTSQTEYSFTIPEQEAGALVSYKITAIDNANPQNETNYSTADTFQYISGNYKKYDDGNVDLISTFNSGAGAAVKISVPQDIYGTLVSVLIRNYTDPNLSNDNMLIHIWDDNNGMPGNDLITPFLATPSASLDNPTAFTKIDLRDYFNELMNLTSDFFVGFTVPDNSVYLVESNNSNSRSYSFNGTNWSLYSRDYHIRAVIYESPLPVPVELTTFTASVLGSKVKLEWETATEVNNYGFEILRSAQNDNTKSWEKIAFVQGNGTSNSPKYYSYEDKAVNNSGKYLYRLKQVDIDGTYEYSNEIEVVLGTPNKIELAQNYPNPFNPVTSIQFNLPNDSQVRLSVFNILGEEIALLLNDKVNAGYHSINFNGSELNSGIYFYQLQTDNFTQIRKMMLVK